MDPIDEMIEQSMHAIDFYIAEAEVMNDPDDVAAIHRLQQSAHAVRFSDAYRCGDNPIDITHMQNTRNYVIMAVMAAIYHELNK
jgi:hypothetical protein